jgi:hypothetical protein
MAKPCAICAGNGQRHIGTKPPRRVSYIVGPDRPSGYFVECRRANDMRNSEILARGVPVREAKLIADRHASLVVGR